MNWIQNLIIKLLKITPAKDKEISIREPYTFAQNVLKNRIWYCGEAVELDQFFKKTAVWDIEKARFWAASPVGVIRKMHSGIVALVVDRYRDIIMADIDGIDVEKNDKLWEEIADDNDFMSVLAQAVQWVLATGDGAFKLSTDNISQYPIIEFYQADDVAFNCHLGRLREIIYYTSYTKKGEDYRLEETYGRGYIRYKLYDSRGIEKSLNTLPETAKLSDVKFDGDFIMGEPFKVFDSAKWQNRGRALFDTKSDVLDALDEVISQWLDAIRLGRIKRYIPEDLIPRDTVTGELMPANPFDNDFIAIGSSMGESAQNKVDVSQPNISYEAYVNSYSGFLDLCLQGIISPSTLGIDLKKTDNAESQREKEKITLYVRSKIIDALGNVIPDVVSTALKTLDVMNKRKPAEYSVSVKFGEYASPDFDSTVSTISAARSGGIMSLEKSVDELYGDSMTDEEKAEEILRLKEEQGLSQVEEPLVDEDIEDISIEV